MVLYVPSPSASLATVPSPKWISLASLCFICLASPDLSHFPFSDRLPKRIAYAQCLFFNLSNFMEITEFSGFCPLPTWCHSLPDVSEPFFSFALWELGFPFLPLHCPSHSSMAVSGPWDVALSPKLHLHCLFRLFWMISFSPLSVTLTCPWTSTVPCSSLPGCPTSISTSLSPTDSLAHSVSHLAAVLFSSSHLRNYHFFLPF